MTLAAEQEHSRAEPTASADHKHDMEKVNGNKQPFRFIPKTQGKAFIRLPISKASKP